MYVVDDGGDDDDDDDGGAVAVVVVILLVAVGVEVEVGSVRVCSGVLDRRYVRMGRWLFAAAM